MNWDFVRPDLVLDVKSFSTGFLIREWNTTALTLVPNTGCLSIMKDYRPIACHNVPYKTVAKILATRLQPTLPSIILPR